MGRRTFGKHPFAKTVRITKGVKKPQTNPHLLLKASSLSSVIHIMDSSPAVIVIFDSTAVITGAPPAEEMGFSIKASYGCKVMLLLPQTFMLTGSASLHLVDGANGRLQFGGIN